MIQNRSTLQVENIVVGCRLPGNVRCGYQCQCRRSLLFRRAINPALKRPEAEPLSVVFETGTDNGERDQISVAAREHIRSPNSRLSEPVIWIGELDGASSPTAPMGARLKTQAAAPAASQVPYSPA